MTVHSWVRWLLVAIAVISFFRSGYALRGRKPYSGLDRTLATGMGSLLALQLLLGLTLYVLLSPIVRAGLADLGAAMASSLIRFYVIEHQVAALLAIGVGFAGLAKSRRASTDAARHKWIVLGAGGCLVMILIAIPWPMLPYGRALFRL